MTSVVRGQACMSAPLVYFDLMMHLSSKLQRMRDLVKRLGSSAGSADDYASVSEHPAKQTLFHMDTLHF